MLLGVVAALTAPVAPWVATLACRLADPFLAGLVAVARWAASLPGGTVTLRTGSRRPGRGGRPRAGGGGVAASRRSRPTGRSGEDAMTTAGGDPGAG